MRLNIRSRIASFLISKSLREITAWAQAIAAGDFSKKISISAREEIGEAADALDRMSQQIKSRMEEFIAGKSRLEAVFLSMFDGIMVLDRSGTIILMNQTLREFLGADKEVAGKKPLEVIRHIDIQEIAQSVLAAGKRLESREITLTFPEERILRVHATPVWRYDSLPAGNIIDGAVLVFHDITELRRLEKVRRDFVANVSHELRTPVSTIRGYAETLLEGALEDKTHAREFLKIIYEDSDRLARLINDLLDLSRIESGTLKLDIKESPLEPVIDRVLTAMQQEARKYSVRIQKEIPPHLAKASIDDTAIAQVLFNLMENAIKYNKKGGSVTIGVRETPRHIEVSVTDTGLGIPQEDLPRIFERFYRVDKARSRELGGTGLGLAIVKHIVQAHRGDITVESRVGRGSTFRVTLPKVF